MQLGRSVASRMRLRGKVAFLAATATMAVLASTAYLTLQVFRAQLLEALAESSSNQSDALRVVLEEQMAAGDLSLLRRLVADIGRERNIASTVRHPKAWASPRSSTFTVRRGRGRRCWG
jgi:hypothetical protein